jgi:hypothetical protein
MRSRERQRLGPSGSLPLHQHRPDERRLDEAAVTGSPATAHRERSHALGAASISTAERDWRFARAWLGQTRTGVS